MSKIKLSHLRAINFSIRYGRNSESIRSSRHGQFRLHLGPCSRKAKSVRWEAIRAAKQIRKLTSKPIIVCYSGGLDSELVLSAFRAAGISVECAIIQYRHGLNRHDISAAIDFCKRERQSYRLVSLDIQEFLLGHEYTSWRRQLNNHYPIAPSNFFLFKKLSEEGLYPVGGCGEPAFTIIENSLFIEDGEINFALEQFCAHFKIDGEPSFFRSSPELYFSILKWFSLSANGLQVPSSRAFNVPYKTTLYHEAFGLTPRRKFHGYEKLLERAPEMSKLLIRERHPTKKIDRLPLGQALWQMGGGIP